MITQHFAYKFTEEWIAAWNSHNLDNILCHYTDDFSLETPMALKIVPESGGILKGKEAIRAYWAKGLELIPELFFEVYEVLIGINGLTIYYINRATEKKSAEVFFFNDAGKVTKSFVYYVQ